MPKAIGYQLASASGRNIQGDDSDPTGFASFEIMDADCADTVVRKLADEGRGKDFLLQPICDGDIEKATIVTAADLTWAAVAR